MSYGFILQFDYQNIRHQVSTAKPGLQSYIQEMCLLTRLHIAGNQLRHVLLSKSFLNSKDTRLGIQSRCQYICTCIPSVHRDYTMPFSKRTWLSIHGRRIQKAPSKSSIGRYFNSLHTKVVMCVPSRYAGSLTNQQGCCRCCEWRYAGCKRANKVCLTRHRLRFQKLVSPK